MIKIIFIFQIVIFVLISFVNTQNVYPIDKNAKCEKYLGDSNDVKCSNYLTNKNSVYIPGSTTQTQILSQLNFYFKLLKSYGGDDCQTVHTSMSLCSMMLPECETYTNINNSTDIAAIPIRVCRDTCKNVTNICGVGSFYNCSQLETDTNQPMYPILNEIYNLTNYGESSTYSIDCYNPPQNDTSTIEASCPYPLVYRYTTTQDADKQLGYVYVSNQSMCTIRCPAPIMSTKDWNQLLRESDSLGFISLLCSLYLVITYLVVNKKRNKYDYFFGFFTGSIFLMSLAGTMGFFYDGRAESVICPEINRRAVETDKACVASGFIFQLSIVNAVLYWCIQSFELWYQIHYVNKKLELLKYYIPIVFVVSLIFSIPIAAKGQFKAGLGNFLCWIDGGDYQNGFFWIPFGIALTVGTGFIILVIYEIYKIVRSNNKKDFWKLQIKPILNVVLVYLTFIYLFGFNFYVHNNVDSFYDSIVDFYTCLLSTDGSNCFIKGPSPSGMKMFAFCIRIYGVYAIILYGFNLKARRIWKESIIFNNSLIGKLKTFSNLSKGNTSSTDVKMSTHGGNSSQFDSGGGVSSSMENDDGVTIY